MLKLMKTQDVAYIALQKRANERKLKRLEEELTLADAMKAKDSGASNQHILFADDSDELTEIASREAKSTKRSVPKLAASHSEDMLEEFQELTQTESPEITKKREELAIRKQRVEQLSKLEYKFNLDRQLLAKGKRQKVGTDEYGFAKYKWAVERKR